MLDSDDDDDDDDDDNDNWDVYLLLSVALIEDVGRLNYMRNVELCDSCIQELAMLGFFIS
jgi:hypothetical protein